MFKIGDWVRNNITNVVFKVAKSDLAMLEYYERAGEDHNCEHWQPKDGDYAIHKDSISELGFCVLLYNEKILSGINSKTFKSGYVPFIGELPK